MMGGMSLGGGAISILSEGSKYAAQALQQWRNEKMQRRAFNQALYLDSTKYQRSVADLRKAGLNPILAAGGGVRGGGGPSVSPGAGAGVASGTGFAAGRIASLMRAEAKKAQNAARASEYEPERANWAAASAREQAWLLRSQGNWYDAQRRNYEIQNKLLRSQVPSAQVMERFDKTPAGERLREIRRYIDSLSPFIPRGHFKVR